MKLVAFFCGMLISAPLCAVEKEGLTITITQEEDAACTEGGGCLLVPRQVLETAIEAYAQRAYSAGQAKCKT